MKIFIQYGKIFSCILIFISFALPFKSIHEFSTISGFDYLVSYFSHNPMYIGAWILFLSNFSLIISSIINLVHSKTQMEVNELVHMNKRIFRNIGICLLGIILIITYTFSIGVLLALISLIAFAILHHLECKKLNLL